MYFREPLFGEKRYMNLLNMVLEHNRFIALRYKVHRIYELRWYRSYEPLDYRFFYFLEEDKMIEDIKRLKTELEEEISNVNSMNDLSDLRLKYLGKKSMIQEFGSMMKNLSLVLFQGIQIIWIQSYLKPAWLQHIMR